jgi:hypothetical protein
MKSKTLATLAMILGIALSTSAFAQGRHDEKPHGSAKPAVVANEQCCNPQLSTKKSAAQKDGAKAGGAANSGAFIGTSAARSATEYRAGRLPGQHP